MTDTLRQAAQQVLDYWESCGFGDYVMVDKMDALRAALAEQEPVAWSPPTGMKVADIGFVWDGEAQQHTPKAVVYFEPVPANSPANAKGWVDRDAFVAMLNAAPEAYQPKPAEQEPVHGDVLPPVGSRVYIRHGRDDDAHACTVTGYYAWADLGGSTLLHRVFVQLVYEGTTTRQARLLRDCYPTAEAALAAAPEAPQPAKREPLTPRELRRVIQNAPEPSNPNDVGRWVVNVCHAAIAAYERKNGIGGKQ